MHLNTAAGDHRVNMRIGKITQDLKAKNVAIILDRLYDILNNELRRKFFKLNRHLDSYSCIRGQEFKPRMHEFTLFLQDEALVIKFQFSEVYDQCQAVSGNL